MIYSVTEWHDNDSERFFFDDSKVNPSEPFEVAYLNFLQLAAAGQLAFIRVRSCPKIQDRFNKYQNSMPCWERLKAKPPCKVDIEVKLVMYG